MTDNVWSLVIMHLPATLLALAALIQATRVHKEVRNGLAERLGERLIERCPMLRAKDDDGGGGT